MGSALSRRLLPTAEKRPDGSRCAFEFVRTSSLGGRDSFSQEINGAVTRLKTGEAAAMQRLDHRRYPDRNESDVSRVRRPSSAVVLATNANKNAFSLTSEEIDLRIDSATK